MTALERITNAVGFLSGNNFLYAVTFTMSWKLDGALLAGVKSQRIEAELARVRQERAVRDRIHEAWQLVRAGIAKSRAARAQAGAATLAANYAHECYKSGGCSQLEIVQAQRDADGAEVARIQADAELRVARVLLRLESGQSIDDGK
jgi:outer membrane protein TolC